MVSIVKKFIIILFSIIICNSAWGFEIVYPKHNESTINSPTTFFIGSSKSPMTINGAPIPLHRTGAFAHFVKLDKNVNTFVIKSDDQTETYTIKKKSATSSAAQGKQKSAVNLIEYQQYKYFTVEDNNSPLRATPVDGGINRIAHLQKGVLLTVNGEKGSFYRVFLNNNKNAWIDKRYVKETEPFKPAKLRHYKLTEDEKYYTLTFNLDKKVPFEIIEGNENEPVQIKFYNTDREHFFKFPYREKAKTQKLFGYSGEYIDNDFIFKIRKYPKIDKDFPLKGITITVDAGHGGKEIGAIGCLGSKEKDIVLNISKFLEKELISRGANVIMTRNNDKNVALFERIEIANKNDSDIFVSIHNNALPDTLDPNKHRGTSIFYYYNQSMPLGKTILDTITSQLGTNNDNLHQMSFAVVRNTNALSVLIEVAYLINPDDNELLMSLDFQQKTAKAIADGIERYLKE